MGTQHTSVVGSQYAHDCKASSDELSSSHAYVLIALLDLSREYM